MRTSAGALVIVRGFRSSWARHRRQVGWAFAGRVATAAGGVALTIMTARILGPSDRGVFALAILVGALVALFPRGFTEALAYQLAVLQRRNRVRDGRSAVTSDTWVATVCASLGLAVASAGIVVAIYGQGDLSWSVGLLVVATLLVAPPGVIVMGLGLAESRMSAWAIALAGYQLGALTGVMVVVGLGGRSLLALSIGWACGAVIAGTLVLGLTGFRLEWRLRGRGTRRRQGRYAVRVAGGALLRATANRSDIVLLGLLSGTAAVGLYSVAVGASELVLFLGGALQTATYGRIGTLPLPDARRLALRVAGLSLIVAAAQGLVLAAIAYPAMSFVFGSAFRDSGEYLILLLPGTILSSAVDALSVYYQNALGRPGLPLLYSAANAVATVSLCLALIPVLGTGGAAVSSAAGSAIAFVIALGLMFRTRPSPS